MGAFPPLPLPLPLPLPISALIFRNYFPLAVHFSSQPLPLPLSLSSSRVLQQQTRRRQSSLGSPPQPDKDKAPPPPPLPSGNGEDARKQKKKEYKPVQLIRPLGMEDPPQKGENSGIDTRTVQQKRDDFVNWDKHLQKRKKL